MLNLLIATDLTQRSDIALQRAIAIAGTTGATLHALHVVDGDLPLTMAESQREGAERFVAAQLARLDPNGKVAARISAVLGDPTTEILAAARDFGEDLIVIGGHRHRGLAEFLRGTIVDRLTRMSPLPLLVRARRKRVAPACRTGEGLRAAASPCNPGRGANIMRAKRATPDQGKDYMMTGERFVTPDRARGA